PRSMHSATRRSVRSFIDLSLRKSRRTFECTGSGLGAQGFRTGSRLRTQGSGPRQRDSVPYIIPPTSSQLMSLAPGTRIGVYEITAPIAEGGMGQVFRARDTKLDRDVAIKILPEAFAHDAERLVRFQREAKTLASLNNPHIAAIYGLEEGGDLTAL